MNAKYLSLVIQFIHPKTDVEKQYLALQMKGKMSCEEKEYDCRLLVTVQMYTSKKKEPAENNYSQIKIE